MIFGACYQFTSYKLSLVMACLDLFEEEGLALSYLQYKETEHKQSKPLASYTQGRLTTMV